MLRVGETELHNTRCDALRSLDIFLKDWWSRWDSNPRPPRCHRGALPTAPRPHLGKAYFDYALPRGKHDLPGFTGTRSQLRHGPTWEKLTSTTHCPGKNTIFPVSPGRAPNCATAPLG